MAVPFCTCKGSTWWPSHQQQGAEGGSGEETCDAMWHVRLISQVQPCSKEGPISSRDPITP